MSCGNSLPLFVDADNLPSTPLVLNVNQLVIFYRQMSFGAPFLHQLDIPASNFQAQQVDHTTTYQGQPANTYVIGAGRANAKGTGDITVQFKPPAPGYAPFAPVAVPFTIG